MTRFEALVSLNLVPEIGSIRLKKLLEAFGTPENILKAPQEKLTQVYGIGEKITQKICAFKKEDLEKELSLAKRRGLKIITLEDADYPQNLKNIYDPPPVLYVKGELKKEDEASIAIVGSRRASFYGLSCAQKFASDLAENSFTIISGMARGVDTAAHKGALKQKGRTIAVIGSGFKHLYPPENRRLADEIAGCGAVISEFPIETKPLPQNFPQRNRVISGLSLGVLVVEAARNSGALITANFALEQGREVFALPGKVDSGNSFGTNALIKDGAKLVSCVEDILEELNGFAMPAGRQASCVVRRAPESKSLKRKTQDLERTKEEDILYNALSKDPVSLDELAEKTAMSIPKLSAVLFKLQIKKLIQQLPGKQYIRSAHAEEELSYR